MKNFLFIYLFIFIIILSGKAQNYISITGKIVNSQNNEAIPLAHIYTINKMIGSISNTLGNYRINIAVQKNFDTIIVSHVGFEKKIIVINQKSDTIINLFLNPLPLVMSEVVINSLTVEMIFDSLIAHISENYVKQPVIMKSFLRDLNIYKSEPESFKTGTSVKEMALEIYKYPYISCQKNKNLRDQIKLLAWRKIDSFENLEDKYLLGIIPFFVVNNDIMKTINEEFVFSKKWIKKYSYKLEGIVPWQNGNAYKITYEKNYNTGNKIEKGVFIIDIKTFALVSYECFSIPENQNNHEIIPTRLKLGFLSEINYMRIDYECFQNKWYLRSFYSIKKYQYSINKNNKTSVLFKGEYEDLSVLKTQVYNETILVITSIQDASKEFSKSEVLNWKDFELYESDNRIDKIWENYNIINSSDIEE